MVGNKTGAKNYTIIICQKSKEKGGGMKYWHESFTGFHPDAPKIRVSVEAFTSRRAQMKIKKDLVSLQLMRKDESYRVIKTVVNK